MSRAVIGLSGGIDSALSAYLSAKALGAENVLAVRMPYKTSAESSLLDAESVIEDLGLPSKTIPITDMADALFAQIPDITRMRMGNVMARLRMIVLYDQSAEFGGLVMGTSNSTTAAQIRKPTPIAIVSQAAKSSRTERRFRRRGAAASSIGGSKGFTLRAYQAARQRSGRVRQARAQAQAQARNGSGLNRASA